MPKRSPAAGDSDGEGIEGRNEWWSRHMGKAIAKVLESLKFSALACIWPFHFLARLITKGLFIRLLYPEMCCILVEITLWSKIYSQFFHHSQNTFSCDLSELTSRLWSDEAVNSAVVPQDGVPLSLGMRLCHQIRAWNKELGGKIKSKES